MIFGSISYLNLLPFQLFLNKYLNSSSEKLSLRHKMGVPSKINNTLLRRNIHAAFVSSIYAPKFKCMDLGIVAKGSIHSVLVLPNDSGDDPASATSNKLAEILNLQGKVLIGDIALKYYLNGKNGIDLAEAWHDKTGLPFVFAKLCYNHHGKKIKKLVNIFLNQKNRVPYYILKKKATKIDISPSDLTWYLEHIHYKIDWRAKQGLKKFLKYKHRQSIG